MKLSQLSEPQVGSCHCIIRPTAKKLFCYEVSLSLHPRLTPIVELLVQTYSLKHFSKAKSAKAVKTNSKIELFVSL